MMGERLDVLILNAGISKAARIAETQWKIRHAVCHQCTRPVFLIQQFLPTVIGEGSNIVVISSVVARTVVGKPGLEESVDPCLRLYKRCD